MQTLAIELPDDVAARIRPHAREKGVSAEEMVRISIEEKLARDEQFESAARHVLAKNAGLYERLS